MMEVFILFTHLKKSNSDHEIVRLKVKLPDGIEGTIRLLSSFVARKI